MAFCGQCFLLRTYGTSQWSLIQNSLSDGCQLTRCQRMPSHQGVDNKVSSPTAFSVFKMRFFSAIFSHRKHVVCPTKHFALGFALFGYVFTNETSRSSSCWLEDLTPSAPGSLQLSCLPSYSGGAAAPQRRAHDLGNKEGHSKDGNTSCDSCWKKNVSRLHPTHVTDVP